MIREYRETDKDALRYICIETAGGYFKTSKKLIEAVPVIYNDYFTENESDNIFVVTDSDDTPAGYIICSSDKDKFIRSMKKEYIPKACKLSILILPAAIAYLLSMSINGKTNSTHLHIDLLPEVQRHGYGTELITRLRKHLSDKGIKSLGVNMIDKKTSAYTFYRKYGFKENKRLIGNIVSLTIPTEIITEESKR